MLARLITASFFAAALLGSAQAEEKVEPYEIKRLIIGQSVVIDEAYAEKNKTAKPSPFSLTIPTGEDFLTLLDAKQGAARISGDGKTCRNMYRVT